jgi:hypothetical protein
LFDIGSNTKRAVMGAVTGAKWRDITYLSKFIREPGVLIPQVSQYLTIDTDERATGRRHEDSRCVEHDEVFSLGERRNLLLESDPRTHRIQINAGHVESVGESMAPTKLIAISQEQTSILETAPERVSAFHELLTNVYQTDALEHGAADAEPMQRQTQASMNRQSAFDSSTPAPILRKASSLIRAEC